MSTLIKISRVGTENPVIVTLNAAFDETPVIDKKSPYFFINPGIWTDEGPVREYPTEIGGPEEYFVGEDTVEKVWNSDEKRTMFFGGIQETIYFLLSYLAEENQLVAHPPEQVTEATLDSFVFYPETPQDISAVTTPWCLVEAIITEETDELEFRLTVGNYVGEVSPVAVATEVIQQMSYFFAKIEGLVR